MKFFGRNVLYDVATAVVITSFITGIMTLSFVRNFMPKEDVLSARTENKRMEPTRYLTESKPDPTLAYRKLLRETGMPVITITNSTRPVSVTPMPGCKGDVKTISKGRKLNADALIKKIDTTKSKPLRVTGCRISDTAVILKWEQPVGRDLPARYKVYVQENDGKLEYRTTAYATTVQLEVKKGKRYTYKVTAIYKTGLDDDAVVESSSNN